MLGSCSPFTLLLLLVEEEAKGPEVGKREEEGGAQRDAFKEPQGPEAMGGWDWGERPHTAAASPPLPALLPNPPTPEDSSRASTRPPGPHRALPCKRKGAPGEDWETRKRKGGGGGGEGVGAELFVLTPPPPDKGEAEELWESVGGEEGDDTPPVELGERDTREEALVTSLPPCVREGEGEENPVTLLSPLVEGEDVCVGVGLVKKGDNVGVLESRGW